MNFTQISDRTRKKMWLQGNPLTGIVLTQCILLYQIDFFHKSYQDFLTNPQVGLPLFSELELTLKCLLELLWSLLSSFFFLLFSFSFLFPFLFLFCLDSLSFSLNSSFPSQAQEEDKKEQKNNEVKLMVVGEAGVGKTTLVWRMEGKEGEGGGGGGGGGGVATDGIDLGEFSSEGVRFLCWDFAGQVQYYLCYLTVMIVL